MSQKIHMQDSENELLEKFYQLLKTNKKNIRFKNGVIIVDNPDTLLLIIVKNRQYKQIDHKNTKNKILVFIKTRGKNKN